MDGVGSATLVRGSDEPSDVLFVANPSRESAIPAGAPPDVMRSYMFFPSHVFYTSPGCWQFTVRVGHEEFHIVRELKALGAAVDGHPSGQSAESLSRDGNVVIKMVDDRRVLIAVDTTNEGRPEDGQIDHLFLFTASESIQLPSNVNSGRGHLEFTGSTLLVQQRAGAHLLFAVQSTTETSGPTPGATRFERSIGLSHYRGWWGFALRDLEQIRQSTSCPNACYEAAGHALRFPA